MHHLFPRFPLAALALVPIFAAGCGTAEYEALMAERLTFLERQSRFDLLYQPAQLKRMALPSDIDDPEKDTSEDGVGQRYPITMRWPKLFDKRHWFVEGSPDHNGRTISNDRLTPPFLDRFPGFLRMGEGGAKQDEVNFLKYYCYLGVVDANEISADELQAQLSKQIKADKELSIDQDWQTVELDKPLAGTVPWKHLRASGPQLFESVRRMRRRGQTVKRGGTFDIYLYEHEQSLVLWAVRIPVEIAEKVNLVYLAEAAAGSIVFDPVLSESEDAPSDAAATTADDTPSNSE